MDDSDTYTFYPQPCLKLLGWFFLGVFFPGDCEFRKSHQLDLVCSTGQSPEPARAEDEHDHPDRGRAGWGRFGTNVPALCAGEQHPGLQAPHLPSQPARAHRPCKSSGIFPGFICLPVVFSYELQGAWCRVLCAKQEFSQEEAKVRCLWGWWWNSSLDPVPNCLLAARAESCRNLVQFGIAFPDLSVFRSQNIPKKHFWEGTWCYSIEGWYKP